MSEVAGRLGRKSALIAWRNPPADVVFCFQAADLFILGAGVVGADAATIALGMADECRRGGLQSRRAAQYRSSVWKFGAHDLFTRAGITETELVNRVDLLIGAVSVGRIFRTARHYGIASEAHGPHASLAVRYWGLRRFPAKSRCSGRRRICVTRGLQRESGARFSLDAFDHGAQTVGALWGQMLGEAEFGEDRHGIGCDDVLRSVAGIERKRQRHQSAHDMGVAVAAKRQDETILRFLRDPRFEPNLAGAAAHLIGVIIGVLVQGLERAAKFDEIAVAILPFVQEFEIADDLLDCHVDALYPCKPAWFSTKTRCRERPNSLSLRLEPENYLFRVARGCSVR